MFFRWLIERQNHRLDNLGNEMVISAVFSMGPLRELMNKTEILIPHFCKVTLISQYFSLNFEFLRLLLKK